MIRVVKSGRMRYVRYVACLGEMRNAYKILIREPQRETPLGRPRCREEDNIIMDLQEIECEV
jgi:hypothetical protein